MAMADEGVTLLYRQTDEEWLRDRVRALEEALAPFSDIHGEGDEHMPDDTRVVVAFGGDVEAILNMFGTIHLALTLGDLRRATRAAHDG